MGISQTSTSKRGKEDGEFLGSTSNHSSLDFSQVLFFSLGFCPHTFLEHLWAPPSPSLPLTLHPLPPSLFSSLSGSPVSSCLWFTSHPCSVSVPFSPGLCPLSCRLLAAPLGLSPISLASPCLCPHHLCSLVSRKSLSLSLSEFPPVLSVLITSVCPWVSL